MLGSTAQPSQTRRRAPPAPFWSLVPHSQGPHPGQMHVATGSQLTARGRTDFQWQKQPSQPGGPAGLQLLQPAVSAAGALFPTAQPELAGDSQEAARLFKHESRSPLSIAHPWLLIAAPRGQRCLSSACMQQGCDQCFLALGTVRRGSTAVRRAPAPPGRLPVMGDISLQEPALHRLP